VNQVRHSTKKTRHAHAAWLLSIPASEAPSERIFSIAVRMFGKLRQGRTPQLLEMLTFCQKNAIALRRAAGMQLKRWKMIEHAL